MKSKSSLGMKIAVVAALLIMGLVSLSAATAEQPLSKDDVTLLLLGSTPAAKMVQLVEQRGIDFQMDGDLAKKFRDQGADDDIINALKEAANKAQAAKVSAPAPAAAPTAVASPPAAPEASAGGKPNAPDAPEPAAPRETPSPGATPAPAASTAQSSSDEPVLHTRQSADSSDGPVLHARQSSSSSSSSTTASSPSPQPASPSASSSSEPTLHQAAKQTLPPTPATASGEGLKDPSPTEIQHIIQEFAAKEKIFKEARNNYTYHQINKVEELGPNDQVTGSFQQEWDITYDDKGNRIERVTYAPEPSLKRLILTKEDYEGFRNIQPFVLTTDELNEYDIKYLGHVHVDEITTYVFSIRPKEIEKGKQYFQGQVYVDDRDLQIVKSQGRQVPQDKKVHGQENLFPEFTTWREQVDGKFWFPTFTMANDTLYFESGAVHMKEIVRYTDYKQFKSGSRILNVEAIDKQNNQSTPASTPPKN